ncbi:AraC family transcriptional regulator [Rhizobium sp. YIC5082]|nr:AraC family transcriptional regulator [Rhizobium sp. YIC5082]
MAWCEVTMLDLSEIAFGHWRFNLDQLSGLDQGPAELPGLEHDRIAGHKFLIGRTGRAGGDFLLEAISALCTASDVCFICLPVADALEVSTRARPLEIQTQVFLSVSASVTKERLRIAGTNHLVLAFKAAALEQAWRGLGKSATGNSRFKGTVDLPLQSGSQFTVIARLIWNSLYGPEKHQLGSEAVDCLFQSLLFAISRATAVYLQSRDSRLVSPAMPLHVKRAIAYMRLNFENAISITAIASAAGTSVRALQIAFKRFKGTSPVRFLLMIRLEVARTELLCSTSSSSVAVAARKAGFSHMGRFAAAYRNAYGESPSQTSARAVASSVGPHKSSIR